MENQLQHQQQTHPPTNIFTILSTARASVRALLEEQEDAAAKCQSFSHDSNHPRHADVRPHLNSTPLQKLLSITTTSSVNHQFFQTSDAASSLAEQQQQQTNHFHQNHPSSSSSSSSSSSATSAAALISTLRRRVAASEEAQLRAEQQAAEATALVDSLRQRLHATEEARDDSKRAAEHLTAQRLADRTQVHQMSERGARLAAEQSAFEQESAALQHEAKQAFCEVGRTRDILADLLVRAREHQQRESAAEGALRKMVAERDALHGRVEQLEANLAARGAHYRAALDDKAELERRHRLLADQLEVVSASAAASQQAHYDTESLLRSAVESRDKLQRMTQQLMQEQFEASLHKNGQRDTISDGNRNNKNQNKNDDDDDDKIKSNNHNNGNNNNNRDDGGGARVSDRARESSSPPSSSSLHSDLNVTLADRISRLEAENDVLVRGIKDKNAALLHAEAQLQALQRDHAALAVRQHVADAVEAHARAVQSRCEELERVMAAAAAATIVAAPGRAPASATRATTTTATKTAENSSASCFPQLGPSSHSAVAAAATTSASSSLKSSTLITAPSSSTGRRTRFNDVQQQQLQQQQQQQQIPKPANDADCSGSRNDVLVEDPELQALLQLGTDDTEPFAAAAAAAAPRQQRKNRKN